MLFPVCGLKYETAKSKFIFEFKTHYFIVLVNMNLFES